MANLAQTAEPTRGEKLSWEEIKQRFPDEWVALVDVDAPNMTVVGGIVFAHHPDRTELHRLAKGRPRPLSGGAILWTGKIRGPRFWVAD